MAKNIDAKLKNIQGIFSDTQDSILSFDGTFIIPDYQRAYNWKANEQCDKLWQDIIAFIDNNGNETYFFGSIIINNDNEHLYVIDGQQRITTFILLLKALLISINENLKKISTDEDSEGLKEAFENRRRDIIKCLYTIDEDEVSSVIKGTKLLTDLNIKYTNKSINEEYPNEVETILKFDTLVDIENNITTIKYKQKDNKYTNFFRNFKFFKEKLDEFNLSEINDFAKTLLKKCQVIVVISYQTEEAIEIFNSLNSTGMPLADADILSAKLYSNFDSDKTEFNKRWSNIIKNTNDLGAQKISTIDDILNQYMYILRAKNNEKDTTLPGVRRYFTDINKTALKDPKDFISGIEKVVDIWQDDNISLELMNLKQILFKHNNNFKFFYATYMYFNGNETEQNKQNFLEALLKLFAILSIKEVGYSSSNFKLFLISLNMEIGKGVATQVLVEKINKHIFKEFDPKDIFDCILRANANNAMVYLNDYLFAKEKGVRIDLDTAKIEVEHIMPGSGRNIVAIREDAYMNEAEFDEYVNKIGNKILLEQAINGAISNDWFKTKKQQSIRDRRGYKDSIFPIARSLTYYSNDYWNKGDIAGATLKSAKRITEFIFGLSNFEYNKYKK